jgi:hypothetical protein
VRPLRRLAGQCNAQSLRCRRTGRHNEASSPLGGLHFGSTTPALPALTIINKRLIFLEREKSIGRLHTSRQPTIASRRRERNLNWEGALLGSRAAELVAVFVFGRKIPWRSDMTRFS